MPQQPHHRRQHPSQWLSGRWARSAIFITVMAAIGRLAWRQLEVCFFGPETDPSRRRTESNVFAIYFNLQWTGPYICHKTIKHQQRLNHICLPTSNGISFFAKIVSQIIFNWPWFQRSLVFAVISYLPTFPLTVALLVKQPWPTNDASPSPHTTWIPTTLSHPSAIILSI